MSGTLSIHWNLFVNMVKMARIRQLFRLNYQCEFTAVVQKTPSLHYINLVYFKTMGARLTESSPPESSSSTTISSAQSESTSVAMASTSYTVGKVLFKTEK